MVTNVTSLTRSGLADFVLQRVSAVVLALYGLCVVGFFVVKGDLTHSELVAYFGNTSMRLFSTLALLSLAAHAWIGMWTIGTDYLREAHVGGSATTLRLLFQAICMLVIFIYVAWGLWVFWSV
ncbi:MAG: succinate dehydrogenase, hydrophobic membrane anchor protein [Pseudomonadales bacterium]